MSFYSHLPHTYRHQCSTHLYIHGTLSTLTVPIIKHLQHKVYECHQGAIREIVIMAGAAGGVVRTH